MALARSFDSIALGKGKIYIDYGEDGEQILGYTRGGEFTANQTIRHINVDGKPGHVKGDSVFEESLPQLSFTAMQMDASMLIEAFFNFSVTDGTDGTGTIAVDTGNPVAADYHTNVAFVGKTKAGDAVVIKVLNALGEGSPSFTFTDKEEIEIPALFVGHYATADTTDQPYTIETVYADSVIA